jgi:mRNA interferase RelE/StbE
MNLKMTKRAHKALDGLDAKQYRQVVSAIMGLMTNPNPHDSQLMHGSTKGERRIDVGEYRIVYAIEPDLVEIVVVGKRNDSDVYKIWDRLK